MSAIDKFQNDAKHIASTLNVSGRFFISGRGNEVGCWRYCTKVENKTDR